MASTYKNYIGGKWVPSRSGKLFPSLDPASKKIIGKFQQSTRKDVENAVRAAHEAQSHWAGIPAPHRGDILFAVASILRKRKNQLAKLVSLEMGKVIKEGMGDVQEAIDIFTYMAGEGRRLFGNTTPSELKQKACYTVRRPVGVVGLITPWNFPFAIPAWKLAPALICGNGVVFKPSSDTPLCAIELVKILEEAGVPKGVVNLVTGGGGEVGNAMIVHPKIGAISFTGSRATGESIVKKAGIKKVGLEMGGKNAIIIMDDADLELAVEGVIWGAFGTTGQRCTAASRVIVTPGIQKEFEERLLARTEKLRLGNGLKASTDVGPLINQNAVKKSIYYTSVGKRGGATMLCGGEIAEELHGFFFQPTIFTKVHQKMRIAQEEIFGPIVSILSCKDLQEAIAICNHVDYGLSSAIYTSNIRHAFLAIEHIEAGITYVNSSTIGAEAHLPFGGVKMTGNGTREAGWTGIEEFSEIKTVYIDYSGRLQKAQIDVAGKK